MEKLILVSHGKFCEGIKDSVEMILGPQEHIFTVSLLEEDGPQDLESKFTQHIDKDDDVVVFVDILGGTPANIISKLIMQGEELELYTGMNLPMIISYLNGQMINEEVDYIYKGRKGIVKVNDIINESESEEDE
ncbi:MULTISPECIES: PTS sugar transporter subunit IIA [Mammaliicoccus]|uniref:PTS fructose transporter subunit IIA n=1 Tax=Mammaliicoccus lentus TaxID=42858 RepID=A0ABS6GX29_MAMLE|nr:MULTISPECIES: PTS fructose transporter subunit IIA [Mammaliicoccus]HIS18706.1 PTS fructose transporter subunit IIA [Candidatus Coprovivens excrementavium]MBU6113974.1 PTS fructose transporter subunit IIA [Mammaliicoccus lentus]MBW0762710.1 PTS fructose transporter subunit IIA [Mammaliicoccus lentus]MBW0770802.1 PTS fructose transporter subunit IIA [Mammaliicoccus lentus]MCD2478718.1 PTS fructose transporter subunit IIA [Mammaliicoccus lentus]